MTSAKRIQFGDWEKKLLIGVSVLCGILFFIVLWLVVDARHDVKTANPLAKMTARSVITESSKQKVEPKNEAERIVQEVAKHMFFPPGEVVVASITDVDTLRQRNPVFFQYAKKGDKLLLYPNGIVLYDESADRIVDVWRMVQDVKKP